MSNKYKQTTDYWRHSTILYERTEMQLAVSTVGFDVFIKRIEIDENDDITIYCHSVDPDFVLKNEHLDKVFVFDSFGGDGGN